MSNLYKSTLASAGTAPTGDAVAADVLAGKTFSNASATGVTGTMVNNGAVSGVAPYTIPEGYHNGQGTVTAPSVKQLSFLYSNSTGVLSDGTTSSGAASASGTLSLGALGSASFSGTTISFTFDASHKVSYVGNNGTAAGTAIKGTQTGSSPSLNLGTLGQFNAISIIIE